MDMSWLIKVKNFLLLLDSLIYSADKSSLTNAKTFANKACAFAFAWSFGSIFEGQERIKFHKYMKDQLKFQIPDIKDENTIFEYNIYLHFYYKDTQYEKSYPLVLL